MKHGYDFTLTTKRQTKLFHFASFQQETQAVLEQFDTHDLGTFYVYLVRFGTYGSYRLPSTIYVNVCRSPQQVAQTILHEITHLLNEKKVVGMSHKDKERFIDNQNTILVERLTKK